MTEDTADMTGTTGGMTGTMTVIVNGRTRDLPGGTTVAALVVLLGAAPTGVAVAVNDTVVPRGGWESVRLCEADRVEVLTAVQGG
jgi:sulfur carrier protein